MELMSVVEVVVVPPTTVVVVVVVVVVEPTTVVVVTVVVLVDVVLVVVLTHWTESVLSASHAVPEARQQAWYDCDPPADDPASAPSGTH